MTAAGMTIVEIARIASKYDTEIARKTHSACVEAAVRSGGKSLKRLQREFSRTGAKASKAADGIAEVTRHE